MKSFVTEIIALDPITDELRVYAGDIVNAVSWNHAEIILQSSERGYMAVTGELEENINVCEFNLN